MPILFFVLGCTLDAQAARISELEQASFMDQALRFFSLRDPSLRNALLGSVLMGICCGLLGSFIVVRKMSLMGDALSHAVLPGVAIGFLFTMTKNPVAIFIGATVAGLAGAALVHLIQTTTKHKEDAALGFVLTSFFAVGICLLTMINNLPGGQKSGLDKFMFGQAAALSDGDILLMTGVTALAAILLAVYYKGFFVVSFDTQFAQSLGFPTQLLHYTLMLLLAFAIVVSLQAVGVVMVSAMLITPAAAAYLLTDRFPRMLLLAALFGMAAGVAGAFLSFVGRGMPTGPVMVLAASLVFALAFLFGPRHGVVVRWWRQRSQFSRTGRENTLKAIYHVLEARNFLGDDVSLKELAERRRETIEDASAQVRALAVHGLASVNEAADTVYLTPPGFQRACEIVRNHRLWELYLTNAAQIAADHVHDDAEKIEHVLGEETVRRIEKRLNYATRDPHGRLIPGLEDVAAQAAAQPALVPATGYGADRE